MSGRPKRTRNAPVRFGFENSGQICDDDEEVEIEESPPQKANKVQRVKKDEDFESYQRIKKEEDVIDLTQVGPEPLLSPPPAYFTSPTPISSPTLSYGSPSPFGTVPKKPGPRKKVTLTRAKADFKLNDADLSGLSYDTEENPHGFMFAPMRLYKAIDCWNVAMTKYGSLEGLQVAIEKGRQRGSKAKATRDLHAREKAEADARRSSLTRKLHDFGIPTTYLGTDAELLFYIGSGMGDMHTILDRVKQEAEHAKRQELERIQTVRQLLQDHGLLTPSFETSPVFQIYFKTGQGLEDAIRKHGDNLQKEKQKIQRVAALNQKLLQLGLPPQPNASTHRTMQEYMKGKESLDVAAPRYVAIIQQEQRRARVTIALHVENLWYRGQFFIDSTFQSFLATGDEDEFSNGMAAIRTTLNPPKNNNRGAAGGGGYLGQPPPPPPLRPPGLEDNICSVNGCGKICSLKCSFKMCGVHKKFCQDPQCKKHSPTGGGAGAGAGMNQFRKFW